MADTQDTHRTRRLPLLWGRSATPSASMQYHMSYEVEGSYTEHRVRAAHQCQRSMATDSTLYILPNSVYKLRISVNA